MAAPRNRRHLLVRTAPTAETYTPHPRRIEPRIYPGPANRQSHAAALRDSLVRAQGEANASREATDILVHGAQPGLYIQFESPPGVDLKLESLENRSRGIEIVAVGRRTADPESPEVQLVTAFVPDGALVHFFNRFRQYAEEKTRKGEP